MNVACRNEWLTADGQRDWLTGDWKRQSRRDNTAVDQRSVVFCAYHELLTPPGGKLLNYHVTRCLVLRVKTVLHSALLSLKACSRSWRNDLELLAPPGGDVSRSPHAPRADSTARARHPETRSDVIISQVDARVDRRPAADNFTPVYTTDERTRYFGCRLLKIGFDSLNGRRWSSVGVTDTQTRVMDRCGWCSDLATAVLEKMYYSTMLFAARTRNTWTLKAVVVTLLLLRRDCVCMSVTLMYCAQTTESMIMRPSPDCKSAILIFPHQIYEPHSSRGAVNTAARFTTHVIRGHVV